MISLGTKAAPVASPFSPEQQKRFDEGFAKAIEMVLKENTAG